MKKNMGNRREFIKKSAALTAALPLLHSRTAHAAGVAPLRLIQIFNPFQVPEPYFHPQVSSTNSALAPAGSSFYLNFANSVLAPLAPYQNDLIIFRGLKYSQGPDSHASYNTVFTGAAINGDSNSGTSLDQYLFKRMGRAGSLTPFCAAPYGYAYGGNANKYCISFNNGVPVLQTGNAMNLYNTLFANFVSQNTPAAVGTATRRQHTLNLVKSYLNTWSGQVPGSSVSQSALQSHMVAAEGLRAQIAASVSGQQPACTPPLKSSITNDPSFDGGVYNQYSLMPGNFDSFNRLITQALACDVTRFCSFKMSDMGDPSNSVIRIMPGLENFNFDNFHDGVTHRTTGTTSAQVDLTMALFKRFFMIQVANLLAALKAVPDPFNTSQTLYDNTVVLIGSEGPVQTNGSNTHGQGDARSDQPFIIAGGCGGYFKKGQILFAGGGKTASVNHNALLTNIVNTFEKNQQQFNPNYVPNILTQYGVYSFNVSPTAWLA